MHPRSGDSHSVHSRIPIPVDAAPVLHRLQFNIRHLRMQPHSHREFAAAVAQLANADRTLVCRTEFVLDWLVSIGALTQMESGCIGEVALAPPAHPSVSSQSSATHAAPSNHLSLPPSHQIHPPSCPPRHPLMHLRSSGVSAAGNVTQSASSSASQLPHPSVPRTARAHDSVPTAPTTFPTVVDPASVAAKNPLQRQSSFDQHSVSNLTQTSLAEDDVDLCEGAGLRCDPPQLALICANTVAWLNAVHMSR